MRRIVFLLVLAIFFYGCQEATFLIRKGEDTKAYYLGIKSTRLHRLLCESGDFKSILKTAQIRQSLKDKFYKYVCVTPSREKVFSLYKFLSPEERDSLKRAFVLHDYDVNYVPC